MHKSRPFDQACVPKRASLLGVVTKIPLETVISRTNDVDAFRYCVSDRYKQQSTNFRPSRQLIFPSSWWTWASSRSGSELPTGPQRLDRAYRCYSTPYSGIHQNSPRRILLALPSLNINTLIVVDCLVASVVNRRQPTALRRLRRSLHRSLQFPTAATTVITTDQLPTRPSR